MDTSDIPRKFFIPYRCLIPPVAAGSMIGKGAVILRSLVDETGAEVQILRSEENPRGLDDRILILNGPSKAKGDALKWVLARLRDHFKKNIDEPLTFVSLIPGAASPVVIGNKGSLIRDLMSMYRVEISIGRDRVKGTEDSPMTIKGRSRDIVDAMARVHHIVQELHEAGKLVARDFTFCKIFPTLTSVREEMKEPERPRGNAPVRLVVTGDEMNVLVSNEGIKQVEQIEDKHRCKITVEEGPRPPLKTSEEVLCVQSDNVQHKYSGVTALLRLVTGMNKQRSAGLLMEAKIAGKVIGSRGTGINKISSKSECFLKLRREGDHQKETVNLMECSGSPEAQVTAVELLVKRIDSFTEEDTSMADSKPVEPDHTLSVRMASRISEELLRDIQKSSRCEIRAEFGGPEFELRGTKSEISKAVFELLAHDVIEEKKEAPPPGRQRRRPEQSSDEEIDYS
jgi:hypothetical protein